jgi:hypothetical protein
LARLDETGRPPPGDELDDSRLVTPRQVLPAALDVAGVIAANGQRMVQGAKRLLNEGIGRSFRERFDREDGAVRGPLRPVPVREAFRGFLARNAS